MSEIFDSYFTLRYNNKELEEAYQAILCHNLKRRNIIYTLINLAIVIVSSILLWFIPNPKFNIKFFKTLTFVLFLLSLTILIVSTIFNNKKLNRIISFLNFYLLIYSDTIFRSYFVSMEIDTVIICLVYTVQYLFLLTWYYTWTIDFLPGCLITVAKCVSFYALFGALSLNRNLHFRYSVNEVLILIICMFSYFYVFEKRKSFYYFKTAENSRLWYHNILENMNTGFISVTNDGAIKYINKSLLVHLDVITRYNGAISTQVRTDDGLNASEREIFNNNFNTLDNLFKCQQFASGFVAQESSNSFEKITEYLKFSSFDNYVLIGINSVKTETTNLHFEVYGRYYTNTSGNHAIENYEFIFNDITRVKSNEEINAEFKFKSMFLAKVAHEFKNPILCITELADQIGEKLEPFISPGDSTNPITKWDSFNDIKEIIFSIKSMSDYLLILIKDMDFFSIKNTNMKKAMKVDKEYIDTKNLVIFLKNITTILLKKFNKENAIQFSINYNVLPREVYTDEIKLKQVLINLLSNAVKYTMSGSINLELKYEGNFLSICVKDSGRGISEAQRPLLYKPFMEQNKDYNHIGAGLGLSIVKELVELLGGEITYEPNSPEGSKFYFTIEVQGKSPNCALSSLSIPCNGEMRVIDNEDGDSFEIKTVEIDYNPAINTNLKRVYEGRKMSEVTHSVDSLIRYIPNQVNIIIVDDEVITRKSTIRLIDNFCKTCGLNVNFIEVDDGIECLYSYYQCFKNGEKVSLIICDQNMTFMNGTNCAKALCEIVKAKNITNIPFYLVTAYESFVNESDSGIESIYTKPLIKKNLEDMFIKSNLI
jgi:signal transduction histidine kinase/CheY-like chemotaxis protein